MRSQGGAAGSSDGLTTWGLGWLLEGRIERIALRRSGPPFEGLLPPRG